MVMQLETEWPLCRQRISISGGKQDSQSIAEQLEDYSLYGVVSGCTTAPATVPSIYVVPRFGAANGKSSAPQIPIFSISSMVTVSAVRS